MTASSLSLPLAFILTITLGTAAGPADKPWLDASQPIPQRVAALMKEMTDEEMAAQLQHDSAPAAFPPSAIVAPWNSTSWGAMTVEATSCLADPCNDTTCRIENLRALQNWSIHETRLGIPISFVVESSHCGAAGGTIFPMGVTQGASWNTSLAHDIGVAIAAEARAWGCDRGLSPEINVCTDPRFGRVEENFGEDPTHVAAMTVAAVTGLQGGAVVADEYLPPAAVVTEAKHCCAYGMGGRDGASADVSESTLHNVYLRPWNAFVENGGRGMMMSHNDLNGYQMHAHKPIMTDWFRGTKQFKGFFASDAGNIDALQSAQVAYNLTDAAAIAIAAGMDQSMGGSAFLPSTILPALKTGEISHADLERAVAATLTQKFAAGLFDGKLPDPTQAGVLNSAAHRKLAREAVRQSAVLLINAPDPKRNNRPLLPLELSGRKLKVAIIGPNGGCDAGQPPPGQCTVTEGIDCPQNDIQQIQNITTEACCALCLKHPGCVAAVLATDANQCLLKSTCAAPTTMPNRVVIRTGRGPVPSTTSNPWSCLAQRAMLGGYSNLERTTDDRLNAKVVTLLEAAQNDERVDVSFQAGVAVQSTDTSKVAAAAALAKASDVAIVVVGDSAEAVGYDGSASCGEGADRPTLDLPGVQLELLSQVLDTGTPTVILLIHGRPVSFGEDYGGSVTSKYGDVPLYMRAHAVISAFRVGVEGGNGLWDLLTGEASFSGRLAQAWPHSAGAVHYGGISPWFVAPCSEECPGFTMNLPLGSSGRTLDPTAPLFPFGHGLDYLSVSVVSSSAALSADKASITTTVILTNKATVAGARVVQWYFSAPITADRSTRPSLQLAGFTKIHIAAGATATATVEISTAATGPLARWSQREKKMVVDRGSYVLKYCESSTACDAKQAHSVAL